MISWLFVPKVGATNDFDLAENLNKNKNNIYVWSYSSEIFV